MTDHDGFTSYTTAEVDAVVGCPNPDCQVEGCPVHDKEHGK
jgi:hypothetical protein